MKKSEAIRAAMSAVIRDEFLDVEEKLVALEFLFDGYGTARYMEKREEEAQQ